jgi:hypothetical protein
MYSGRVAAVNLPATNAFDVFELVAPADSTVVIHSIVFGQSGTADFGDAQAEGLPMELLRASGTTTSGSGGSTPTPAPHSFGDPAFGGTLEASNTTVLVVNTGALTTIRSEAFNVQAGYQYLPTPEERIILSPSQSLVVRIPVGPADAIATTYATITFEECGG